MPAGDSLEVITYERLLPLKAEKTALSTLQAVRKGDCLVAFSRREVHTIKRAVDAWGALKCCVVYGALPAEARTQQVQLRHGGCFAHAHSDASVKGPCWLRSVPTRAAPA